MDIKAAAPRAGAKKVAQQQAAGTEEEAEDGLDELTARLANLKS